MGERYVVEDTWTVPCELDVAWGMVEDVAAWPRWWPDYRRVERLSPGDEHGVGARWRAGVRADLPYTLDFVFTVVAREPPRYVRTRVEGFFSGDIDWRLEPDGAGTRLTLSERTETRWPLINLVARLGGRRLLEANHRAAMRRGEEGLRAILATGYLPPRQHS
jgi:carbon monoxide dehydrogenase subunit G